MRVLFLGGAVKVEVHSLVWKSIKFATASREGGRPAPAMTLLRVYFLGLKNRGNRGTPLFMSLINSIEERCDAIIKAKGHTRF